MRNSRVLPGSARPRLRRSLLIWQGPLSEVQRGAKLVKKGWSIKWVLIDTEASGPLLNALSDAGILVEMRTVKGASTEFTGRILPNRKSAAAEGKRGN